MLLRMVFGRVSLAFVQRWIYLLSHSRYLLPLFHFIFILYLVLAVASCETTFHKIRNQIADGRAMYTILFSRCVCVPID